MATGEGLNALKQLLGQYRETIMEEVNGRIAANGQAIERSMHEYFSSLGCVLDKRFGDVEALLGKVEADTKEIKKAVSRMETKLDGLDRYIRMCFDREAP